jgi:hypothetical protein
MLISKIPWVGVISQGTEGTRKAIQTFLLEVFNLKREERGGYIRKMANLMDRVLFIKIGEHGDLIMIMEEHRCSIISFHRMILAIYFQGQQK